MAIGNETQAYPGDVSIAGGVWTNLVAGAVRSGIGAASTANLIRGRVLTAENARQAAAIGTVAGNRLARQIATRARIVQPEQPDPATPEGNLYLVAGRIHTIRRDLMHYTRGPKTAREFFFDAWHPAIHAVRSVRQQREANPEPDRTSAYDFGAAMSLRDVPERAVSRDLLAILNELPSDAFSPDIELLGSRTRR